MEGPSKLRQVYTTLTAFLVASKASSLIFVSVLLKLYNVGKFWSCNL